MRILPSLVLSFCVVSMLAVGQAQTPAPPADKAPVVKLEKVDELERENIRLAALVTSLQKENAEMRLQLQSTTLQTRASAFVEKMKKSHPDFDVNPDTLELTPKKTADAPKP